MNRLTHTGSDEYDFDPEILERVLELTDGGNPVRFIDMDEPDTARGVIRGISSVERLAGWRLANQSFFDPPKEAIIDALDDRERELTGKPITPEPDPAPEPSPGPSPGTAPEPVATDGGVVEEEPDEEPEETTETTGADEDPLTHPDATALEAGQVIVVELESEDDDQADVTEYAWPADVDADEPYIVQIDDGSSDLSELSLSKADLFNRFRNDETESIAAEDVAPDAPATAALRGEM